MNAKSRRPLRPPLFWCAFAMLAGCNLVAGIEEGKLGLCPDGTRMDEGSCAGNTTGSACSPPWENEDPETGHCYFYESAEQGWKAARQSCLDAGGDLATINSAEELTHLTSMWGTEVWVGGTDLLTEGLFVWANGEPWEFAPWIEGAPTDPDGKEDCVVLADSPTGGQGFDDRSCGDKNGFICEIEP